MTAKIVSLIDILRQKEAERQDDNEARRVEELCAILDDALDAMRALGATKEQIFDVLHLAIYLVTRPDDE